jgi:hypothetical protein
LVMIIGLNMIHTPFWKEYFEKWKNSNYYICYFWFIGL